MLIVSLTNFHACLLTSGNWVRSELGQSVEKVRNWRGTCGKAVEIVNFEYLDKLKTEVLL